MNLEFVKKDNWEAEFEATADFNLHIEGVPEGQVRIYQRGTSDGEYAYVREATPYPSFADVYDFDFSALVYPKWIRVVCGNKPTSAQIVTDGDVQQMKFQDKTVEIASNGTTLVTPDEGFTALGKVSVNVNVPTSGGGGTELEGEYFLAKPNGRYWKFTFMPEGHKLRIEDFETSQIDAMIQAYAFLLQMQCISGAAVSTEDASLTDIEAQADGFYNIGSRINGTLEALKSYKQGYDYDPFEFNDGFLRVWRECDIKSNPPVEIQGFSFNNVSLIELMKETARLHGMEITDDEAIPLLEQSFMITPATEEEYKYWRLED